MPFRPYSGQANFHFMEQNTEKINADEWLKDLPVTKDNPAFRLDEMIDCRKCLRTNPPTRLKCLYCGAELEFAETVSVKPNLRKMENWEKAFNLIFTGASGDLTDADLSEAAKMTRLEKDFLQKIFNTREYLPLARAESKKEAEIVKTRLGEIGVETRVVSDEDLLIEKLPRRLRGLEFDENKIRLFLFNEDKMCEIAREDLILIVTGAIFERRIESIEQSAKNNESKILETSEIGADTALIDVYSRDDKTGYRIAVNGFDFSCLGAEKGILARENVGKLAKKLGEFAPDAKFVDDYLKIRPFLGTVWETEQSAGAKDLKRKSFGKFKRQNTIIINNLAQFTKYSRLQWQLL